MNLVPIKVKIGLRPNKHADHPDWQLLPLAKDGEPGLQMSDGWHYDKKCGHAELGPDSPIGMQWGMVFVTPLFARQAMEVFPDLVTEMTPAEAEDFWTNRCMAHLSENKSDVATLQALQVELALRKELEEDVTEIKTKIIKALNPNDDEPGVKRNKMKKFTDYKILKGLTLVTKEDGIKENLGDLSKEQLIERLNAKE